jgi:hypothetical protein
MDAALLTIRGEEARLMNTKRLAIMFFGVTLVLGMAGQAQAISYQWSVNGTFNDGGTLSGTLDVDTSLAAPVTAWNLTTTSGSSSVLGITYNGPGFLNFASTNTATQTSLVLTVFIANSTLTLAGYTPNLSSGGPYTIGSITETQTFFGHVTGTRTGSAVATPEPASLLLFGSGLVALGVWRYRKGKKAS